MWDEELWLRDEEQSELPTSKKIEEQPKEPFNEIALGHEPDFDVLDEHTDVRGNKEGVIKVFEPMLILVWS